MQLCIANVIVLVSQISKRNKPNIENPHPRVEGRCVSAQQLDELKIDLRATSCQRVLRFYAETVKVRTKRQK